MSRFIEYLKDTRAEVKHVSWPTQRQATIFTVLVVLFSIIVALLLGFADFVFGEALNWFIG
jgi:preprotein translocase SecE subunit